MQYIVALVIVKCVWSLVKKIMFGIKNKRRIKKNERIMSTPGRWC